MHVEFRNRGRRNSGGFTLLELALVMIIFGILIVGLMGLYTVYLQQMRIEKAERVMSDVRHALLTYRSGNQKYPCPARAGLDVSDPAYGVADCTIAPVGGVMHGTIPDSLNPFSKKRDIIQTGFMDPWLRRLNYAVTVDLSQANATPFDSTAGLISVVDENNIFTGGVDSDSLAHFAVWSTGGDGDCDLAALDGENCNGDNTFRDSLRYDSDNTTQRYNDYITYFNGADISIWSSHLPNPGGVALGDAKNDNSGNIGIGVTMPAEKVQVAGDVSLSGWSLTNMICKDGTTTCIKPEALFNIDCSADAKKYIKSVTINSSSGAIVPDCQNVTFPAVFTNYYLYPSGVNITGLYPGGCPSGVKYVLTNGDVLCH